VTIIAVSASAFHEDRERSLQAGCNGFIAKPLHRETLLQEIKTHLGLTWIYETPANQLQAPDFETPAPMVLPSHETLEKLSALALMGDIGELEAVLDQMAVQDPAYRPFITQVGQLAKSFKVNDIRKLMESYLG
jgi:hypothetical protein